MSHPTASGSAKSAASSPAVAIARTESKDEMGKILDQVITDHYALTCGSREARPDEVQAQPSAERRKPLCRTRRQAGLQRVPQAHQPSPSPEPKARMRWER